MSEPVFVKLPVPAAKPASVDAPKAATPEPKPAPVATPEPAVAPEPETAPEPAVAPEPDPEPEVQLKSLNKMSKADLVAELEANGVEISDDDKFHDLRSKVSELRGD